MRINKFKFVFFFLIAFVQLKAQDDQWIKKQDSLNELAKDCTYFFPQKKFSKVIGYTYNKGIYGDDGRDVFFSVIDRKTKKLVKNVDSVKYIFSETEVQKLLKILNDANSFIGGESGCYLPHHAFVFYDKNNKINAWIDVCFMCHQTYSFPRYPIGQYGALSNNGYAGLFLLCKNLNMPMQRCGTNKTMNDTVFEVGDLIQIPEILYDLNNGKVWGHDSLDVIVSFLLKHPELTTELSSHTDSRGSALANMKLSENRARSCVDYLLWKTNFPKDKIISKGYGESEPLISDYEIKKATTKEEKEELHANNRRTELLVLKVDSIK